MLKKLVVIKLMSMFDLIKNRTNHSLR